MISCYIIGDFLTRKVLKEFIENSNLLLLKGFAEDLAESSISIGSIRPDIIFVDAVLIERNKALLNLVGQTTALIVVSGNEESAYDAFEVAAFDYLVMPLTKDRFEASIHKFVNFSLAYKKTDRITESFFVRTDIKGQKELLVKCGEISYIEAFKNYVMLHMDDGRSIPCHHTMKEVEDSLPTNHFLRVHKSFMINYNKVTAIEGNHIFLNGSEKDKILIGSTYRKVFFGFKNQKVIKKQKNYFRSLDYSTLVALLVFYTGLLNSPYFTDFCL